MEEKAITAGAEECANLERLHYEAGAASEVIRAYLDDHRLDPDGSALEGAAFKAYQAMHLEKFAEYTRAKDGFAKAHGLENRNWKLDFATREVTLD